MAEQFGKYEIEEVVGQGAFGTVYRAVDESLGRAVALKVLHPILMTDELWVNRFRREGTAMARLHHPHIAVIYEIGELTGRLFIAMQYVPGPNLGQRLKDGGPLGWAEALRVTQALAGALDHAHRAGVLHRDLKPENIILGPDGPVLTDFGVARLIGESRMGSTLSGGVVGTPHYIAPEVWRGQPTTEAADLYALACIVAEMLTGKRLYDGPSTPAVMHAHFQPPPLPEEWPADAPPGLSEALNKALSQEPEERYAAAGEFASALAALDAPRKPVLPVAPAVAAADAATASVALTVSTGEEAVKSASETPHPTFPASQAEPQQPPGPSHRLLIWLGVIGAVMMLVLCIWGLSAALNGAGDGGIAVTATTATATPASLNDTLEPTERSDASQESGGANELPAEVAPTMEGTYTVQAGDTFFSIATSFGLTLEELSEANGIENVNPIEVGQVLIIPDSGLTIETEPNDTIDEQLPQTYVVQPGDFLGRIAQQFGVTAEALAAYNGIEVNSLFYPGDVFLIPPPGWEPGESDIGTSVPSNPPADAELGDTWVRPADGMTMLYVPAGSFLMGSDSGDSEADDDEFPQHEVTLDGFWIDRTEVTGAQFGRFVSETGHATTAETEGWSWALTGSEWVLTNGADWQHPAGPGSDLDGLAQHPVLHVSWYDAQAYCNWAGGRLPTEAEWEYAARGPEGNRFAWGDDFDGDIVNFCDANCAFDDWADNAYDDGWAQTAPVGSYPAGASWVGALDMAGNVWEWVQDWYDSYDSSPAENPAGPTSGDFKVLRGGSWNFTGRNVRSASRSGDLPEYRIGDVGFRCASPQAVDSEGNG